MRMRKVEEPNNQRAIHSDEVRPVVDVSEIAPMKLDEHDVSDKSEPDTYIQRTTLRFLHVNPNGSFESRD